MKSKASIVIALICALILFATGAVILMNVLGGSGSKGGNPGNSKYAGLNYSDYITLGEYKDLTYESSAVDISDEDLQDAIDDQLSEHAEALEITEGEVAEDDLINVDYVGTIDGKEVQKVPDISILVGAAELGEDVDKALIGASIGTEIVVETVVPEDSEDEDLAGKDITYTVKINHKEDEKIHEYNLDFVKSVSEFTSLEDYEADLKAQLTEDRLAENVEEAKESLMSTVMDNSEARSYPEGFVDEELTRIKEEYQSYADMYGMTMDEFRETFLGYTEEEMNTEFEEEAKSAVFEKLIAYAILEKEGIKISKSDFKDYLSGLLEESGYTEETFKEDYEMSIEEYAEQYDMYTEFVLDQAKDIMYKNATAVPASETASDDDEELDEDDVVEDLGADELELDIDDSEDPDEEIADPEE